MIAFLERLFECIGGIDDVFIQEAETADIYNLRRNKRKKIAAYSAAGLAVSVGATIAYFVIRQKRAA